MEIPEAFDKPPSLSPEEHSNSSRKTISVRREDPDKKKQTGMKKNSEKAQALQGQGGMTLGIEMWGRERRRRDSTDWRG